jgi:hypothetical protein
MLLSRQVVARVGWRNRWPFAVDCEWPDNGNGEPPGRANSFERRAAGPDGTRQAVFFAVDCNDDVFPSAARLLTRCGADDRGRGRRGIAAAISISLEIDD